MNPVRVQIDFFSGPFRILEERRFEVCSSSWLDNILVRRNNLTSHRLEEIIDIDRNLSLFFNEQLNTLNPRRLYGQGLLSNPTFIFRHYRTEALHLSNGREKKLNLMKNESVQQLLGNIVIFI